LRGVAQLGSALDWGSSGRRFKSCRSDQKTTTTFSCGCCLFCINGWIWFAAGEGSGEESFPEMSGAVRNIFAANFRFGGDRTDSARSAKRGQRPLWGAKRRPKFKSCRSDQKPKKILNGLSIFFCRIGYELGGGDNWFRTSDLLLVEQALSQLSYAPENQSD
jgi:hypothetical protein